MRIFYRIDQIPFKNERCNSRRTLASASALSDNTLVEHICNKKLCFAYSDDYYRVVGSNKILVIHHQISPIDGLQVDSVSVLSVRRKKK